MSSEPTRHVPGVEVYRVSQRRSRDTGGADWFADEIAIDFPSVSTAVDRMRDAFLAPEELPREMSVQIRVSALKAFTGTVVVLDMPLPGTCRTCGGRGETWSEPCGPCRGSGETLIRHPVQINVPPRSADGAWVRLRVTTPHALTTHVDVRVTIVNRECA